MGADAARSTTAEGRGLAYRLGVRPRLPVQVEAPSKALDEVCVLAAGGQAQRLDGETLCPREAARRGVAPGMALAEARALASDLLAVSWDEERLSRAALEVTTALLAASPRLR